MLQYNGMSGCNPASHKICKNNAITMTVYKVPGVNILVKVQKRNKKKINIMKMYYFLFATFLSKLSGFHCQRNLTYLKSGALQCGIVKMYLSSSCEGVRSAVRSVC